MSKRRKAWTTHRTVVHISCIEARRTQLSLNQTPPDRDHSRFACGRCSRDSRLCVLYVTDGKTLAVAMRPEDRSEASTPLTAGYLVK